MNLYHYTKLDTAIRFILPFKELRMNQAKNMNDPKENLINRTEFWEYGCNGSLDESTISGYAANETKILSFSTDDKIRKRLGYKNQKMWWQYAESNTGVCLKIDYDLFVEENKILIDKCSIKPDYIDYSDNPFDFIKTPLYGKIKKLESEKNQSLSSKQQWDNDKKSEEYIKKRFFTKHTDWEDEKEFRFLTTTNDSDICLSIEKSLQAVYLGILINRNYIPSIERLVTCNLRRLYLFNGGFNEL